MIARKRGIIIWRVSGNEWDSTWEMPVNTERGAMKEERVLATEGDSPTASVYHQYHARLYRYLLKLSKNQAEAEDLVQETFLRIHSKLSSLREPSLLAGWLYRIATNVFYDHHRQKLQRGKLIGPQGEAGSRPLEERWEDPDAPRIDRELDRNEMSGCVQEFVEGLSDDYRVVILLHDIEELTNPEMADLLGCSLATVKIRLHRARKKLKAALNKGCEFSKDDRDVLVCDRKTE